MLHRNLGTIRPTFLAGRLEREQYLETYGHLRPGTYDIQVQRYDEHPEMYLKHTAVDMVPSYPKLFDLSLETGKAIERCLSDLGSGFQQWS